jgi:hypothetical protein
MRLKLSLFALLVAVLVAGCALHHPSIGELQHNPGRYFDKTVSIDGVVTSSWGVPLVGSLYRVEDGTGEVAVLSRGGRTPTRGARVRVRGKVSDIGVLGGRALGLHIQEESLHVKR